MAQKYRRAPVAATRARLRQLSTFCHGDETFHLPASRCVPAFFHLPSPFSAGASYKNGAWFEASDWGRGRVLKERRAAAPFGFRVVPPDTRREGERKRSTSINSSYITSLCWCQVAERKGRKESALTLFFSIVRPHLTLCIIPLRVCLHGYRRDPCLPNTTGGVPKILVPLLCSSHSSILPRYYRYLLSSGRMLDFIRGVPPSFLLRWKGRNRVYLGVWTYMQAFPIN